MKASVFVLGLLAAVTGGAAAALLFGDIPGYVVAGVFFVIAAAGLFVGRDAAKRLLPVVLVGLAGGLGVAGWAAFTILGALGDTEGSVVAPDAAPLASVDAKLDAAEASAAFRLELTEDEMRAYALDALRDEADNPISDLRFDLRPGETDGGGELAFEADLKSGGTTAEGAVSARLEAGTVEIDIIDVGLGAFQLPGIAEGVIEDLIERIADFNDVLQQQRADVQSIRFTESTLVITGTQAGTDLVTADSFLTGFAEQAAAAVEVANVPDERFGPGVIDGLTAGSAPFYVALGDSLAANVGVQQARDGYVSRFHNQLQLADGRDYGLRNFAISGESTGTMIRGGQLDDAIEFMESNDVDYVTIDIGANNLLGHLGTGDCSESLDDPTCRSRIDDAFSAYPADLDRILAAVSEVAPEATVIFLTAYNPFDLGFGSSIEADMNTTLQAFNQLASDVAGDYGVVIADGYGAVAGTAAVTTHMLDPAPDIHPTEIGFDLLAGALVAALG